VWQIFLAFLFGWGWRILLHGILIPMGFFVKLAYHVLDDEAQRMKQRQQGKESESNTQNDIADDMVWKRIWKISCPPKVK